MKSPDSNRHFNYTHKLIRIRDLVSSEENSQFGYSSDFPLHRWMIFKSISWHNIVSSMKDCINTSVSKRVWNKKRPRENLEKKFRHNISQIGKQWASVPSDAYCTGRVSIKNIHFLNKKALSENTCFMHLLKLFVGVMYCSEEHSVSEAK